MLGGLGREVPNWKSHSAFLFSKNIFFWHIMVTCDKQEKVSSSQNVLLWIFLKIRYLIWRYAELNRLLVGSGQIPLNIELQQDDHTVCCSHTVVVLVFGLGYTFMGKDCCAGYQVLLSSLKVYASSVNLIIKLKFTYSYFSPICIYFGIKTQCLSLTFCICFADTSYKITNT